MPRVRGVSQKYAPVLLVYPSGLRPEWLMMILPIQPRKKVSKNLFAFINLAPFIFGIHHFNTFLTICQQFLQNYAEFCRKKQKLLHHTHPKTARLF